MVSGWLVSGEWVSRWCVIEGAIRTEWGFGVVSG